MDLNQHNHVRISFSNTYSVKVWTVFEYFLKIEQRTGQSQQHSFDHAKKWINEPHEIFYGTDDHLPR